MFCIFDGRPVGDHLSGVASMEKKEASPEGAAFFFSSRGLLGPEDLGAPNGDVSAAIDEQDLPRDVGVLG